MSAPKRWAARRSVVLRALGETGNMTLAAEKAKLSRDWVRRHRKLDSAFDAACRAAIEEAKTKLRTLDALKPPSGWGTLDGAELAVRGAPGRRVQIRRARRHGWSPSVETRFLSVLAATCNVTAACAAIELTQASAYYHRRQWPAFAERWAAALDTGYVRLEAALIEHAGNIFSAREVEPDVEMPPMNVEHALHLLYLHRHAVRGIGKPSGGPARPLADDADALRASILRKIEAIERGERVSAADRAASEREWARRRG